ncbi:MAG: hypothetical protein OEZ44_03895 [Candidatus Bathyarchaeota archaeon]|nr:hypothetical protein [Candidatus Bathyarchaeota archaeon]
MSKVFSKLEDIDRRYYYWAIFLILAVPFIKPLGMPISIKQSTRDLYKGVDQVEPGEVVLIDWHMSVSTWPECLDGLVAELKVLTSHDVKIVITSISVDCEMSWNKVNQLVPALRDKYEYGKDIVFLGYYAGGEPTNQQMAIDVWSVFPTDHFKTPIAELPLMAEARTANDYAIVLTTGENEIVWVNQWWTPYGVPVGVMGIAMKGSALQPYYNSGDIFGLAVGVRGGAEFELLIGEPAGAVTRMDSISLSHLSVVILIIIANTGVLYNKLTGGKK